MFPNFEAKSEMEKRRGEIAREQGDGQCSFTSTVHLVASCTVSLWWGKGETVGHCAEHSIMLFDAIFDSETKPSQRFMVHCDINSAEVQFSVFYKGREAHLGR